MNLPNACCPEPSLDDAASAAAADDERLAALMKALGHPGRVAIVRLLLRKQACVCGEIVDALPLAQSTVSQHLKILKETGIIQGTISGPSVCYCIEPAALEQLHRLLQAPICTPQNATESAASSQANTESPQAEGTAPQSAAATTEKQS